MASLYVWRYRPMVRREVDLAGLTERDRILNVGCGSIPATAINLARLTGAEVVCLDFDREAVANARRVVSRYGLDGDVTVREGDGRNAPTADYTAAVVALHTIGKSAFLDNFLAGADPGDRAVVRYPRPSLREHYGRPSDAYRPEATVSQVGMNLDRSALFTRA